MPKCLLATNAVFKGVAVKKSKTNRFILALCLMTSVFAFAACGSDDDSSPPASNDTNNANNSNNLNNSNNVNNTGADMGGSDAATEDAGDEPDMPDVCPDEPAEAFDEACDLVLQPCSGPNSTVRAVKEALIVNAMEGDTVCFVDGFYPMNEGVSVDVTDLTLRGQSREGTVFDFLEQSAGANGISVTSDGFRVQDLTIKNTPGDGIRVTGANGVTFSNVGVTWDGGPSEENGAYGLYPVQCQNVLVENSVVSNASDAGIYVGQSEMIIVRDNEVFGNVAGIEVENSSFAEVVDNNAHDNTGGILIFDLPDLPVQGGSNNKIHRNRVVNNNTQNFAPEGNIVGEVPTGTGILILSSDNNDVHDNTVTGNGTLGIAIASYLALDRPVDDPDFDPYPEGNFVHNNRVEDNGDAPAGRFGIILSQVNTETEGVEDLVWGGIFDDEKDNTDGSLTNCFWENEDSNGDPTPYLNADIGNNFEAATTDLGDNLCQGNTLESVELPE